MEGDAIPLDVQATVSGIRKYVAESERQIAEVRAAGDLTDVHKALGELELSARSFSAARDAAVAAGDAARLAILNRQAMSMERAFTNPDGLRERPWYRHLLHAPDRTYAPLVLPGIAEALATGDHRRIADEAARVAQALRRAAATLR
jgi:N-acetylated-alpha-linked acidic dipeptidase